MSNSTLLGAFALVAMTGAAGQAEAQLSVTELAAITSAISAGSGISQETDAHRDLYFSSQYGYCDAMKVAQVWNTDTFRAKAIIGSKIAAGLTHLLDRDIASTAASVRCSWEDLGLEYAHAEALAAFWGSSPYDAKLTAGSMASSLGHKRFMENMAYVLDTVGNAAPPAHGDGGETHRMQQVFFQSDYGYCDALKVAHVWGTDVGEAKAVIGRKITEGLTNLADADIASTATSVSCSWVDTGLSFDDALTLADFWGVPVGEAKAKATQYTSEWGNHGFQTRLGTVLRRG
ncbi:hypothetical protein [Maricaulis sp.]|uniref:hypothetical protein n=1 Tax=Maricaulis sp. TaxID=1486257 RepID=UPI002B2700DC|nr:hypothetical protein [Maricaulis sp.]